MAKKFSRIEPVRVEMPAEEKGGVTGWLVEQLNRVLERLVTQINDVLQKSTARLMDVPLWCRGEVIEINQEDVVADDVDVAVRHNLGATPRYWVLLNVELRSDAVASSIAINRSITQWTDTHVFFRIPTWGGVGNTAFKYEVLLIP